MVISTRALTATLIFSWSLLQTVAQSNQQLTDETFRTALTAFVANEGQAETLYGPIETWDISTVTDFSSLGLPSEFQKDLSAWNTSSGITMAEVSFFVLFCFGVVCNICV